MKENDALKLKTLEEALSQLDKALQEPLENELAVDATIKRFQLCMELSWKWLRRILMMQGIEIDMPRPTLQKAYVSRLIDNEDIWLDMLKDRNKMSHIYKQKEAREAYERIKHYYPEMKKVFQDTKQRFFDT